ncbi:glyoxalase [Chryseobacterium sp.]|uniref:glyoxalase n=1 Tax=Chryseobacterium sp. TaxID=1871047 RepID=UPI00289E594B|nr:glyoxalase [Chryseobacterium sp.]
MQEKLNLRQSLNILQSENTTPTESFQNQTLRQVLKLQNDLLVDFFRNYASKQNADFDSLSTAKKHDFIAQSVQKDTTLKNTFIGMCIGMFILEELTVYHSDSKTFNKRIIAMLVERLKDQIK